MEIATRYVFSTRDAVRYRFPTHTNDLVMDRAEAETSEVFVVILEPGESPPMHVHNDAEQVFYILRGTGTLYIGKDGSQRFAVREGHVVRIPPHTYHRILSGLKQQMVYLSVDCFVGGRPKQEPTWDSHVQVMCRQQGWDLNQVRGAGRKRRRVR
jgi:mannose-6-phosphate isomerase-like protein (cupin superfamily)